jgi:hypothetical protein
MQRPIRESAGELNYLRYLDELHAARLGTSESRKQSCAAPK